MNRLKEVEEILRESKHFKAYIRLFELNKEIRPYDEDYVKKQDEKIEYYRKLDLNVERCLQTLSKYELEFIKEIYFNNRTYRETMPLIKKLRYGDGNINRKMTTNISTLLNYTGTEVKKTILNKLLNENILEVA
nr:MAG TPA: hypothetical protein [Caudoviricetes sp.]